MANCIRCGRTLPLIRFGKNRDTCKWCVEYYALQNRPQTDEDVRQHVMPAPWQRASHAHPMAVTYAIMGICAAVFMGMAMATQGASIMEPKTADLLHWGANFRPYVVSGEWWRLLTSVFLHIGIIHIALNMWCLFQLGELGESLYGSFTFAIVYLICGVAGSLASIAWHPATVSAGASGAIFGIVGALIASLKLGEFSMPRAAVKGTLGSIVFFAVYSVLFGAAAGADNAAHIGGLVAGLILGGLIALLAPHRDQPVRRLTICVLVSLLVLGCAAWIRHSYGYVAHLQRASQFMSEEQPDNAIAELQQVLKEKPDDPNVHLVLARAYRMKNMLAQQDAELKRALELHIEEPNARYMLAFSYIQQGRHAQARQLFEQLVAAQPRSAEAHRGLGYVLAASGSHEEAIQEFQRALSLDREIGAYFPMGQSFAKLKKWDEAIEAYRSAIQVEGEDDADIQTALAEAYEAKGMKQQADQARRRAEQMKNAPPDPGE